MAYSPGINHNIDELLVGLHTQIQLRLGSTGAATRRRNSSFSQKVSCIVELQTKVRQHFTITEKAPTITFSWLKALIVT